MFSNHEELFDENMDDVARKKMMQKIRNRISAQESRDRRKVQFSSLEEENIALTKENDQLKRKLSDLERKNHILKCKLKDNGLDDSFVNHNEKPTKLSSGTRSTKSSSIESIKSEEVSITTL
jgi:regulator of replication initiation timing